MSRPVVLIVVIVIIIIGGLSFLSKVPKQQPTRTIEVPVSQPATGNAH